MQTKIKTSGSEQSLESGLVIERRFTSADQDPFGSFDWIEMDVEIRNPDGSMADLTNAIKEMQMINDAVKDRIEDDIEDDIEDYWKHPSLSAAERNR